MTGSDVAFTRWWQTEGWSTDPKVAEQDLCKLAWDAAVHWQQAQLKNFLTPGEREQIERGAKAHQRRRASSLDAVGTSNTKASVEVQRRDA